MKGTKLLFAVWLALLGIGNTWANDADDIARAATRRGATNTVTTTTRKKVDTPNAKTNEMNTISRSTNTKSNTSQTMRNRTVEPRSGTVISNTSRTGTSPVALRTSARTATNVLNRQSTTNKKTKTPTNSSRAAIKSPSARGINPETTSSAHSANRRPTFARSGTANTIVETIDKNALREQIMAADNKTCRDIYYECMDEFCANKDTQLKRCACSSRIHEFDSIKKQLSNTEEKMLEFNQRLLTIGMDAEDAAVLNIATEGETAFNQTDKSESQKILDEMSKKLNTKFNDTSLEMNLTAISLSLNEDTAFDNVDSLMGASTTLKTGTALYSAALPICREMAAEVCTPEQLEIAESGYQMLIEQDCTTVQKSYQAQADLARTKVHEGSALLDMSRLSAYQDRNSDDILTCKKKMLDMLTNTSVCGENLSKCLDTTGKYINPTTGSAFLTADLANLDNLITRPEGDEKWTTVENNRQFVSYLDSKKTFLEPAMENCQDISDYVWDEFVEDALAQIKLAQSKKLEEIRQSCTTLTTQCLTDATKTIEDFDSRALSVFGVMADVTVNTMCANVKNACAALMTVPSDGEGNWDQGMTDISIAQTYDTIMQTCREVGRACIIQACKSISGNFGLCENIDISVNRKSIINATTCWDEVYNCVANAGAGSIDKIINMLTNNDILYNQETPNPEYDNSDVDSKKYLESETPIYSFYSYLYGTDDTKKLNSSSECTSSTNNANPNCVYDICKAKGLCVQGHDDKSSSTCKTCRLTELLWGNCEAAPNTELTEEGSHNKIKQPQKSDQSTLLFWFALNTGTTGSSDSCRDTSCGPGYILHQGTCFRANEFVADGLCSLEVNQFETFTTQDKTTEKNCCPGQVQDSYGNCCINGKKATIYVPIESGATENMTTNSTSNPIDICLPENYKSATTAFLFTNPDDKKAQNANYYTSGTDDQLLVCISRNDNAEIKTDNNITCTNGRFIIYDQNNGTYKAPTPDVNKTTKKINNYFSKAATGYVNGEEYTLEYTESTGWQWESKNANTLDSAINPKHKVSYKQIQQNQQ